MPLVSWPTHEVFARGPSSLASDVAPCSDVQLFLHFPLIEDSNEPFCFGSLHHPGLQPDSFVDSDGRNVGSAHP